jgi:hypothetical protein
MPELQRAGEDITDLFARQGYNGQFYDVLRRTSARQGTQIRRAVSFNVIVIISVDLRAMSQN